MRASVRVCVCVLCFPQSHDGVIKMVKQEGSVGATSLLAYPFDCKQLQGALGERERGKERGVTRLHPQISVRHGDVFSACRISPLLRFQFCLYLFCGDAGSDQSPDPAAFISHASSVAGVCLLSGSPVVPPSRHTGTRKRSLAAN